MKQATKPKEALDFSKSRFGQHSTEWLYRVGTRPPLTAEEEAVAARDIQAVLRLEGVRLEVEERVGRAPTDEEWANGAEVTVYRLYAMRGLGRAWERKIIQSNSRLVHSIALKFKGKGMAYEDLCQEGVGGLLRGAQKFDPSRSAKLSTYCYLWILRSMQVAVMEVASPTRLGSYMWVQHNTLWQLHSAFLEQHRRAPSVEYLAAKSGIRMQRVRVVLRATQPALPSHHHHRGSCGHPEEDRLDAQTQSAVGGQECARGGLWTRVMEALQQLDCRDREILRSSFGLLGAKPLLPQEIALKMNCHHITVRTRKKRAIAKLKALVRRGDRVEQCEGDVDGNVVIDKHAVRRCRSGGPNM